MSNFRRSGSFGEVRFFETCVPSGRFLSLDRILLSGWHRVNHLYCQQRTAGLPFGILLFTTHGEGKVIIEGREMRTRAGEITLIPKGRAHAYMGTESGLWTFFWLHFAGDHSAASAEDVASVGFVFDVGEKNLHLLTESHFGSEGNGIEKEIVDSEFLSRVMMLLLKKAFLSPTDERLPEMIRFLENEAGQDFSLDALASRFHYSKEYIIRLFQRNTGVTPYRYFLTLRLGRSREALEAGEIPISEIAASCGYQTVSAYSRQFKEKFGMTPSEYRAICKKLQN